jgi:hypothetical protein
MVKLRQRSVRIDRVLFGRLSESFKLTATQGVTHGQAFPSD